MKLKPFLKNAQRSVSKHSPEIFTAVGIAGMLTTVVLAVKATPKALKQIEEKKAEEQKEALDPIETVKAAWKPYIPAAITGVVSIGCLIGANSVNAKRNAALATAAQLSATALSEYKEKVNETVDEETKKIINEKVAKEKLKKNPVPAEDEFKMKDQEIILEHGHYLCYDAGGNCYFRSDENSIRSAINRLNARMNGGEAYVALNDLYAELGIRGTEVGDLLGWNVYRHGIIEPEFYTEIAANGEPCLVVNYAVSPEYDYHRLEF